MEIIADEQPGKLEGGCSHVCVLSMEWHDEMCGLKMVRRKDGDGRSLVTPTALPAGGRTALSPVRFDKSAEGVRQDVRNEELKRVSMGRGRCCPGAVMGSVPTLGCRAWHWLSGGLIPLLLPVLLPLAPIPYP